MIQKGWKIVFDEFCSYNNTFDQINLILKTCKQTDLICVAGYAVNNPDLLILAGIDEISQIKETFSTSEATKSSNGEIYWYFYKGKSFGFAGEAKIKL